MNAAAAGYHHMTVVSVGPTRRDAAIAPWLARRPH
jgi:hypothetical protein